MTDYVDRNKVLAGEEFFGEHATWDNPMTEGCLAVRSDFIMNLPAADVVEVKHGRWIDKTWTTEDDWSCYNHHIVICSVCNKQFDYTINEKSNYCPNCGAKMDGGQGE